MQVDHVAKVNKYVICESFVLLYITCTNEIKITREILGLTLAFGHYCISASGRFDLHCVFQLDLY